ncbi:AAA family ATPase [Phaeobacter sp. 11ANDIMAR09]|uniref:AAA family ATPase n=1 Tax=Phaeobacter sp. 11ANDIMAR09 TaxID=1225647 RepID=UPI0006C88492|nr:AAA family ATPase [Phaeobacter sp. 11ANDIMAR09]KPD11444.1 AAA family ATPase [Phaeobacter sp. 11ANDIMAR09]
MPNHVSRSDAKALLQQANRLLVVGCCGGGKTTLSRQLCTQGSFDYISIDRDIRWLPGWKQRDKPSQRRLIAEKIRGQRWIMDGISISSLDLRLPRTDLVLWVRVPRRIALVGIAKRVLQNYGRTRMGMAEGCAERLPDRAFLSYIWNFERCEAPRLEQALDRFGPQVPVVTLCSHAEINTLLNTGLLD